MNELREMRAMRYGVYVYDVTPIELIGIARGAEQAKFDTVWLGEHVVVPYEHHTIHPTRTAQHGAPRSAQGLDPAAKLLEPLVALAAVVTATERIEVATGIYLLTLRHPLLAARGLATLAALAGDRLIIGLGSGWLAEELEALDVPFAERRSRFRESLEVLSRAFEGGPFEHAGRHFQFGRLQVSAEPIRTPIILGGNSDRALQRAAVDADGWFASGTPSFDEAVRLRDRLEHLRREQGRAQEIEVYVRVPLERPLIDAYREAGFRNLIFWLRDIRTDGQERAASYLRAADVIGIEG
jgi:probable F420-dependent oxidoreductase